MGGNNPGPKAMCMGNSAVNPCHDRIAIRKELSLYLERFAHFFNSDFFVRKAFETLNSEHKAEHTGFRNAVETLYVSYRKGELNDEGEDSMLEHFYTDEYFMHISVERVRRFFIWLGVVKDVSQDADRESANQESVEDDDEDDLFS